MSTPTTTVKLDLALFDEAMRLAGEPLPLPKKLSYRLLFGRDWRYSLLGYAYLRCVDNIVDSEEDTATSLELMATQRAFMARAYEAEVRVEDLESFERYGLAFFEWDRSKGSPLRAQFEKFLDTMEFDVTRRGKVPSAEDLDGYVLATGHAFLHCLAYFATGSVELPEPCLDLGSRAYLYADGLMDLEEDLEVGLINLTPEVIAAYGIDLDNPAEGLHRWRPARVEEILEYFVQARESVPLIENRSLKILYLHFLKRKKRRFLRFLEQSKAAA